MRFRMFVLFAAVLAGHGALAEPSVLLSAKPALEANPSGDYSRANLFFTEPDAAALSAYMECSKVAEVRVLSVAEAMQCMDHYLNLKLSFLPDTDLADFAELSFIERRDANRRGYEAYRAWLARSEYE